MASSTSGQVDIFTSLPLEILDQICSYLCLYCCKYCADEFDDDVEQSLHSLVATSRQMRCVAQPHRFHHAGFIHDYAALVNNLVARPDMALCVKQIDVIADWCDPSRRSGLLHPLARKLRLDIVGDPDFDLAKEGNSEPNQYYEDLTLSMLPNLESCVLNIDVRDDKYAAHSFMGSRVTRLGIGAGPRNLRSIKLLRGGSERCHIDRPRVVGLLSAAPKLRHLVIHGGRNVVSGGGMGMLSSAFRHLEALELESVVLEDDDQDGVLFGTLREFFQLCPALEYFRFLNGPTLYQQVVEKTMEPSRMISTLGPVTKTVRHLDLDFADIARYGSDPICLVSGTDLSPFVLLETLKLNERSFCRHWPRREWSQSEFARTGVACITDLLPQTVKSLVIRVTLPKSVWEDMVHLGAKVNAGAFPHLERVEVDAQMSRHGEYEHNVVRFNEYKKYLTDAFQGSSVHLSVRMRDEHEGPTEDNLLRFGFL